jgi:uncharacterized RDD family membrane protein YckC
MSKTAIQTAQNVQIDYRIASLGTRIIAYFLDIIVLIIYMLVIEYFVIKLGDVFDNITAFGVQQLVLLPVVTYSLYMHILFKGRTLGKIIMGIKVVMSDGSPAQWSNFLTRWMLRVPDMWLSTFAVGTLSIIFSDRKQRLGDIGANTIVINTRKEVKISHTILEEVEESYTPTFLTVHELSDQTINEIKELYRFIGESRDYESLKLLRKKVESLLAVQSDLKDGAFIRTVLKDFTYLTQGR